MVALAIADRPSLADRVMALLDKVEYRRADSPQEREAVFRLRYTAYLREDAIDRNFSRRFADEYDNSENVWIFGIYVDGMLSSSIRIHVANDRYSDFPAARFFPDYLGPKIDAGMTIVDPSRFVVDHDASRRHPELLYVTMRLVTAAGEHFGADIVLATVRSEHQAFYRRIFGHRVICEARPYLHLKKPLSLMESDFFADRERGLERWPFFASTAAEQARLFDRPARTETRILLPTAAPLLTEADAALMAQ